MPLLRIEEIEIESSAILKYYTLTIMAKILKTDKTQCCQRCKGTVMELQNSKISLENSLALLYEIKCIFTV